MTSGELTNLHTILGFIVGGAMMALAFALFHARRSTTGGASLPPGPRPLPLLGNVLELDTLRPWLTYAGWAKHYGDIFAVRVLRQNILVISSEKVAKDLLERRSNIYSDRPYIATREPFGFSYMMTWTQYGDLWRTQRRLFHQTFRAESSSTFHPLQIRKARELVLGMLRTPGDYTAHVQRFSAAVIMAVVYDYDVAPQHDDLLELIERTNILAVENMTPEFAAIIDTFPFLLRLPEWFPGGNFRKRARISTHYAKSMVTEPFKHALKRKAEGSPSLAMALELMRNTEGVVDSSLLEIGKGACATAVGAGIETTTSTLLCFLYAIFRHPEVQKRAQAEIEAVVGTDRLPNFDDRPNLPYVEAVMRESLRLYPVAPLGIPHATTTDDVYNGMFIPKGTTIIANIWEMYRDAEIYPEPDIFKPERFLVDGRLKDNEKTENTISFGFGRRVCPGRHTADDSVWIAMVSILAAVKITKAVDDQGNAVDIEPEWSYGITTHPRPFPCSITPYLSDLDTERLLRTDF